MNLNLAECFFQQAEQQPGHPLILGQELDDKTSYAEFQAKVESLSGKLRDAGVNPGDNVGLHHQSGRDYIAFVYALWNCRACVTPLPFELTATEKPKLKQIVVLLKIKFLYYAKDYWKLTSKLLPSARKEESLFGLL